MHVVLRACVHVCAAIATRNSARPAKTRRCFVGPLAGRDINKKLEIKDVIFALKRDLIVLAVGDDTPPKRP